MVNFWVKVIEMVESFSPLLNRVYLYLFSLWLVDGI